MGSLYYYNKVLIHGPVIFHHYVMLTHGLSVAIMHADVAHIGGSELLGKDRLWCTFLNYIKLHKGWVGKVHNWRPDDLKAVHLPEYKIVLETGGIMYGEEFDWWEE
jgi:hypothetical protein